MEIQLFGTTAHGTHLWGSAPAIGCAILCPDLLHLPGDSVGLCTDPCWELHCQVRPGPAAGALSSMHSDVLFHSSLPEATRTGVWILSTKLSHGLILVLKHDSALEIVLQTQCQEISLFAFAIASNPLTWQMQDAFTTRIGI